MKKLYKINNPNPSKAVWDLLSLAITSRELKESFHYSISKEKKEIIRFLYNQSKELFESSKNATISTSPLMQYYSFNLLTKMLIIIKKNKHIDLLKPSHGLSLTKEKWNNPDFIKNLKIDENNVKVKLQKQGTFIDLLGLTKSQKKIKALFNVEVGLRDIAARILFSYSSSNQIAPIVHFRENPLKLQPCNKVNISIWLPEEREEYISKYPDFTFDKLKENTSRTHATFGLPKTYDDRGKGYNFECNKYNKPFGHEQNRFGDNFLITPIATEKTQTYFNQLELLFMFSFIGSNLVRYHPVVWNRIINDDDHFWSINNIFHELSDCFPVLILNEIINMFTIVSPI